MRVLTRLVVLHDPARAERVRVDAVDLSARRHPLAKVEPPLELVRRASPRTGSRSGAARAPSSDRTPSERPLRGRARATGRARAACISVMSIRTPSAPRRGTPISRTASSTMRSSSCSTPSSFGSAREELVQCVVRDRAAELRVDLARRSSPGEQPLDEPGRRAVGHPLELGDVERRLRPELSSTSGCVSFVGRRSALVARSSRRPSRSPGRARQRPPGRAASSASARSRSRSVARCRAAT